MYRNTSDYHQISLTDFNQASGLKLDPENEWIRAAALIPWAELEKDYAEKFPSPYGNVAKPFRMAFGAVLIQKKTQMSDRVLIKNICENPYLQFFIGLVGFDTAAPFSTGTMANFRKRISREFIEHANELIVDILEEKKIAADAEEAKHKRGPKKKSDVSKNPEDNQGTIIIDATCAPSNIEYPQDFALLNKARVKLEEMIKWFHKTYGLTLPRTYCREARKNYLSLAKAKKRPANVVRKVVRKQLGYVKRDLGYIENFLTEGYALEKKFINNYLVILTLYDQQKYMYDNRTNRVEDRIVSISQPFVRPIKRGKVKAKTEFGAKLDISVDEHGFGRLEHISFDAFNESSDLIEAIERYRIITGHYPERVLVDKIYRTRGNIAFCSENGIRITEPKLGRPSKGGRKPADEYKDNTDRIEVERYFSLAKRCSGMGLIMTKLEDTSLASVAMTIVVTNLFKWITSSSFWPFFESVNSDVKEQYMMSYFYYDELAA